MVFHEFNKHFTFIISATVTQLILTDYTDKTKKWGSSCIRFILT